MHGGKNWQRGGRTRDGVTAVRAPLIGVREVKTAFVRAGRRHVTAQRRWREGGDAEHKGVISPACPAGVATCRYAPCAEPSVR